MLTRHQALRLLQIPLRLDEDIVQTLKAIAVAYQPGDRVRVTCGSRCEEGEICNQAGIHYPNLYAVRLDSGGLMNFRTDHLEHIHHPLAATLTA